MLHFFFSPFVRFMHRIRIEFRMYGNRLNGVNNWHETLNAPFLCTTPKKRKIMFFIGNCDRYWIECNCMIVRYVRNIMLLIQVFSSGRSLCLIYELKMCIHVEVSKWFVARFRILLKLPWDEVRISHALWMFHSVFQSFSFCLDVRKWREQYFQTDAMEFCWIRLMPNF